MRSEDIKKRYKEEKRDLNLFNILGFLILFAFINSGLLYAQVFINGFCKYEDFQSTPQLKKIYTCDFNQDSLCDIILFKPGERKYAVHRAINTNKFTESSDKFFDFKIDDIKNYSNKNTDLVFASRDDRTVGLASISYYGLLQTIFKKELNSYPNRIYAADMNNDGFNKIIAAGNSFAGIELINPKDRRAKSVNLFSEKSFESLAIFDFNYDYYNDIVAIDFLDNQLLFISNYSNNYFVIERSIPYLEKISELRIAKFNNDDFYDLMFLSESSVEILLGDSVYSFSKKISVPTGERPTNYTFSDYNNDGVNDVAFLKIEESIVYLSLGIGGKNFRHPMIIFNTPGLEDISSFVNGSAKIVALKDEGELITLSRLDNNEKDFSIAIGADISVFGSFTTEDYSYFFVEDDIAQSVRIFQHSGSQPFRLVYSFPILKKHEIISTDVISRDIVRFFCYSNNSSLLEIIDFNFKSGKTLRNKIVAEGPMTDFIFEKRKKNLIKVLATDKGNLISSVYQFTSKGVKYSNEDTIFNVLGGIYSKTDTRMAYVWRKTNAGLSFEYANILDKSKSVIKLFNQNVFNYDEKKLKMVYDFGDSYSGKVFSYFGGGDNSKLFYSVSNKFEEIKLKNISRLALYKSPNHINLINKLLNGRKKIYVNDRIFDIETLSELIMSKKIDRYSITSINKKNHFTFSQLGENKLTFWETK